MDVLRGLMQHKPETQGKKTGKVALPMSVKCQTMGHATVCLQVFLYIIL